MDFRLEVAKHGSARPHPKTQNSVSFHPKISIRVLPRVCAQVCCYWMLYWASK